MILNRKTRLLYFGLLAVFFVLGLIYFKNILLPLAYSYSFAVFVYPLYSWLSRRRSPKVVNVAAVTLAFLLVSVTMIYLFTYSAQGWIEYLEGRRSELASLREAFYGLLERFNIKRRYVDEEGMYRVLRMLKFFSFSIVNYLTLFALSFVFYVFIYISPDRFLDKYVNIKKLGWKLRAYLKYKFLFSLATGISVSLVLASFNIEYWKAVGIFTFILNFIPNIGSIVATLLPLPMYYLKFGLEAEFWFLAVSTSMIQFFIGNMVEPKVMGNLFNVPGIIVVVALLFWGQVWGALGVFFAVPSLIALAHYYPKIRRYLD